MDYLYSDIKGDSVVKAYWANMPRENIETVVPRTYGVYKPLVVLYLSHFLSVLSDKAPCLSPLSLLL